MELLPKRAKGLEINRLRTTIRQQLTFMQKLKELYDKKNGMTLIEVMASLVITVIISSVIIYTIGFETRSWNTIVPNSNARSNATFVLGGLQTLFQNIGKPSMDLSYPSGTAITATDPTGAKVEIRLQQPGIDHVPMRNGTPIEGFQISVTPAVDDNNKLIQPDVSNELISFNDTSFNGTTFSVNSSMVDIHFQATYYGSSSPSVYQIEQQFATGGGVKNVSE